MKLPRDLSGHGLVPLYSYARYVTNSSSTKAGSNRQWYVRLVWASGATELPPRSSVHQELGKDRARLARNWAHRLRPRGAFRPGWLIFYPAISRRISSKRVSRSNRPVGKLTEQLLDMRREDGQVRLHYTPDRIVADRSVAVDQDIAEGDYSPEIGNRLRMA